MAPANRVAHADARVIAAIWTCHQGASSDLPSASGGEISDMYVLPENRGRGIAPTLIALVASQVLRTGGRFIKGHIGEAAEAFYRKIGVVCEGREFYLGGRAFRTLAGRAAALPQRTIRPFPTLSENFER